MLSIVLSFRKSGVCIGQSIHHWTESGASLTVTNSNSNFGGCSALAEGYNAEAPPQDTGFAATHQRVPTDLFEETNNIRRIYIGTINAYNAGTNTITLDQALTGTVNNQPDELGDYTCSWLYLGLNPTTADYRNTLANAASQAHPPILF